MTSKMRPVPPMDPEGPDIDFPSGAVLMAEIIRTQGELIHATKRHRRAWRKMKMTRDELEVRAIWAESDFTYKTAVSDVRWWREERTACAASLTALLALQDKLRAQSNAR